MIVSKRKRIRFSDLRQHFVEHGKSKRKDELEYQLLQKYFEIASWQDGDKVEIIFYISEWVGNQHAVPIILFEAEEEKYVELQATAVDTFAYYLYKEEIGYWDQGIEFFTDGQRIVTWIDEYINSYTDAFFNPFPIPEEEILDIEFLRLLRRDMLNKYYSSNVTVKLPGTKHGNVIISVPETNYEYTVFKYIKDCFARYLTKEILELASISYGNVEYFEDTYSPLSLNKYLNLKKENDMFLTAEDLNTAFFIPTENNVSYTCGTTTASIDFCNNAMADSLKEKINEVEKRLDDMTKKDEKKMMNFDFGIMDKTDIRLSPVGLAMKNGDNKYVAYDKNKRDIIDVDGLTFSADGVLMKMPVAIDAIEVGDLVLHQGVPVYVIQVNEKTLTVMDSTAGEVREISLLKSLFGFNYATKIVSFMDFGNPAPDAKNPFGNLMPLLLMQDKGSKSGDMMKTMMLMGMCGGQVSDGIMFGEMNPYLMMMLMEDK